MAGIWRYKKRRFQKQRDFSGTRLQRVTIAAGRITHVNGKRFHDMGTSTATTNQRQDKQQMVPTQGLQHAIPEVCTIACLHEEGICMGNALTTDIARQEIHDFGDVETTTNPMVQGTEIRHHKVPYIPSADNGSENQQNQLLHTNWGEQLWEEYCGEEHTRCIQTRRSGRSLSGSAEQLHVAGMHWQESDSGRGSDDEFLICGELETDDGGYSSGDGSCQKLCQSALGSNTDDNYMQRTSMGFMHNS